MRGHSVKHWEGEIALIRNLIVFNQEKVEHSTQFEGVEPTHGKIEELFNNIKTSSIRDYSSNSNSTFLVVEQIILRSKGNNFSRCSNNYMMTRQTIFSIGGLSKVWFSYSV